MSIISSIRDYSEFLNTLSDSFGNQFTFSKFITETCYYFLKTFQYSLYYIFSFQWLRDFTLLPVTIPQVSRAIYSESFFLETPGNVFFEFLEIPSLDQNKFILGFFNSFFLTLPITVTHLISLRRLIIQGIPAAVFSFLGFIVGQTFFIFCVTFGIRSVLIPWLSLEPFNYILGFIVLLQLVYTMVEENLVELKWNNDSHKSFFGKFFLLNFILAWCEQSSIFQYFSNLTLSSHPSVLEGFSTKTTIASFFSHSNYILGIFLGSIIFSGIWAFLILQLKNLIVSMPQISLASLVQIVNRASFFLVLSFTLSSIPFYGFDYLFTSPLGFVSQDSLFKNTIFTQHKLKDPLAFISGQPNEPLNIDLSTFDRGRYLLFPKETSVYSFEDLNYRGEMDWTTRIEKVSSIIDPNSRFLSITKLFKKQKDKAITKNDFQSTDFKYYEDSNSLVSETQNLKDAGVSTLNDRFLDFDGRVNSTSDLQTGLEQNESVKENFKNFNVLSFSRDFLRTDAVVEPNLEKTIKQKYYSNPIYKNLLALDIDLFLNRQPKASFLQNGHELDLYEKRQILTSYYDSLRDYSKLPYFSMFENFFDGTKSFTNKVYNQQFKGTLGSLRRLFSLSKSSTDRIFTQTGRLESVLKYDQPLYETKSKFSPYHEEVPKMESFTQNTNLANSRSNLELKEFILTDSITKPLYAGWDETTRKFVITNKLLPRFSAGYEMNIPQDWSTKFKPEKFISTQQKLSSKKRSFVKLGESGSLQKINFSVWPKSKEIFDRDKAGIPFIVLFEKKNDLTNRNVEDYTSFPSTVKIVDSNMFSNTKLDSLNETNAEFALETLAPKRGGFIWPGNFPFDFEKILSMKK